MEKKQSTYKLNSDISWDRLQEIREQNEKKEADKNRKLRIKKYV